MTQPRRKWADMRGVVEAPAQRLTEEPIEQVMRRLFCATTDGQRVLNWMVETSHAACHPAATDAALREAEGARRFVARVREMTAQAPCVESAA